MEDDRWERYRRAQEPAWDDGPPSPAPSWLEHVERLLLHLTILGLVTLVLVQMLLTQPPLRRLAVFADRLEGVDWEALLARRDLAGIPTVTPDTGRTPPQGATSGTSQRGTGGGPSLPRTGDGTSPARERAAGASAAGQGEVAPALGPVREGRITVTLISQPSAPGARLLVDGRAAGDFRRGALTTRVRAGQRVEVDGRAVQASLTFRVTMVEGLDEPQLGEQITTDGDLAVLAVAR
ncbi:hypothetical protein [Caldinitratiruptor microaerophilus]|uniref:Uncharacterized protein n=1 Tax=Caldinitratiruptor microaerophilus TaxID=671077 RepID=A0AA35CJM6_9FIRM|nr:hypothetical protein [Caldinitratiruptor microaerophilus]BDG60495.1 hypothetical protein caldi_15850 [Caldinitratiruptor microaerophilus]